MAAVDSGRIAVPAELAGAGPFIRGKAAEMAGELARLRARVAELEFTWPKGTAQAEYKRYQALWDAAAEGLFGSGGSLDVIAMTMDKIWQNYVVLEETNTQGWRHN